MYDFEWFTSILPKTACSSAVFIVKDFFLMHIAFGVPVYVE